MALPDSITAWIGEVMGAPVTAAKRVPGGASREAWFVDVATDGPSTPLFLRYDPSTPASFDPYTLHREAEVYLALADTEVPVPRVVGVHPVRQAILSENAASLYGIDADALAVAS